MPPRTQDDHDGEAPAKRKREEDEEADDYVPPGANRSERRDIEIFKDMQYRDKLVNDTVRLCICLDSNKKLISYDDVKTYVCGERDIARGIAPRLIELASEKLKGVFGLELVPSVVKKGAKATKYVLRSATSITDLPERHVSQDVYGDLGMLFCILTFILMKDGTAREVDLFNYLEELGLSRQSKHPYFHDIVKNMMHRFIEQAYIARKLVKIAGQQEAAYSYEWGARAHAEIDRNAMYDLIRSTDPRISVEALKDKLGIKDDGGGGEAEQAGQV